MFVWTKIFAQQDSLAPGLGEDALDDVSARALDETSRNVAERRRRVDDWGQDEPKAEHKGSASALSHSEIADMNNLKWCVLENDIDTGILSSDLTY
jgi:hypothetical protein